MLHHKLVRVVTLLFVGLLLESVLLVPVAVGVDVTATPVGVHISRPIAVENLLTVSPNSTFTPLQADAPFLPSSVLAMPNVQADEEYIAVQLTTPLGVEKVVEVSRIDIDDPLLDYIRAFRTAMVLRVTEEVHVTFPIGNLRYAHREKDVHMVTLADGRQYQGRLLGLIRTPDEKQYDLSTAVMVKRASIPSEPSGTPIPQISEQISTGTTDLWQAEFPDFPDPNRLVCNPRFALQYWTSEGYMFGGTDRETVSTSFYIKVGEEEILAEIGDFKEISLDHEHIRVKTESDIETSGTLVLGKRDSEGYHLAKRWLLLMDLADSHVTIALKTPIGSLYRISP